MSDVTAQDVSTEALRSLLLPAVEFKLKRNHRGREAESIASMSPSAERSQTLLYSFWYPASEHVLEEESLARSII